MADTNVVISGRYKGFDIKKENGRAYISGVYVDFSKDNVLSYAKVDQRTGNALAGAVIAGAEGAIIASNAKTYLVEIKWKQGDVSLIKVTPDMFEAIVATTYTSKSSSDTIRTQEQKSEYENQIIMIVIGAIWLLLYFIGSNM